MKHDFFKLILTYLKELLKIGCDDLLPVNINSYSAISHSKASVWMRFFA